MPNISPTTILGCTATSSDPDGFVNGLLLKYSDGSEFSTPAALETFAAAGTYTATATVIDNLGATSTTSTTFSVGGGSFSKMASPVTENQQRQHLVFGETAPSDTGSAGLPTDVLVELCALLEDHAPSWYTDQQRGRALGTLQTLGLIESEPSTESKDTTLRSITALNSRPQV
jgi:hypothetical protein